MYMVRAARTGEDAVFSELPQVGWMSRRGKDFVGAQYAVDDEGKQA